MSTAAIMLARPVGPAYHVPSLPCIDPRTALLPIPRNAPCSHLPRLLQLYRRACLQAGGGYYMQQAIRVELWETLTPDAKRALWARAWHYCSPVM